MTLASHAFLSDGPSDNRHGRGRYTALLAVLGLLGALLLPMLAAAPKASAFGTINGMGQRSEHERITRAALACAPGVKSDGSCFEPHSIDQLAGHNGTFGAVGAPDNDEFLSSVAHCDDADYLNAPGYPQSRAQATAQLNACIAHLRSRFSEGIVAAAGLMDSDGELIGKEVDLHKDCTYTFGVSGRAKCNALEGLGRALHGAQDFYSHSNWTDDPVDPAKVSITNPPGLGLSGPSPLLDLAGTSSAAVPADLTTGYFGGPGLDRCPGKTRITHLCLNKDEAAIDPSSGVATDPQTARGRVGHNEQNAVSGAIAETRRQWSDFRNRLLGTYGAELGGRMVMALTQDVPKVDVVFAIDTTGSMYWYIYSAIANANNVLDQLSGRGPNPRLTDYRIGLVDYKDVDSEDPGCPPDYDAVTDLPFSTKRADITSALGSLAGKVDGGCDIPEDVLSGVQRSVEFPWRDGVNKAIIVMGDAAGHEPEAHSGLTSASVIAAANAVDPASIYPVLVGYDSDATAFLTNLAKGTGGQAFDSNAGGVGQALLAAITAITNAAPGGDNAPPAVQVSFPTAPDAQSGIFNSTQSPVVGRVTATDPSGITAVDCNDGAGGLTEGPLTVNADGSANRSLTVTGDGQHLVLCGATDGSGAQNTGVGEGSSPAAGIQIDATAPTVACAVTPTELTPGDGQLVPVTATVQVDDALSGPAGFTLRSVTADQPLDPSDTPGFTPGTAAATGQLRASAGRTYTLGYQGADAAGNTADCALKVTVGAPTPTATVAVDTSVNGVEEVSDGPVTAPPLTTKGGHELLLAYVSADGPVGSLQQVTSVTGGGLTWTPAARGNAKGNGTAEVWQAWADGPVSGLTVSASLAYTRWDGAITVVAYTGAASAVGASAGGSAVGGSPAAGLTTTRANSQLWAVGHDWSRAAAQTPLTGQTLVTQNLDTRVHDTSWVQRLTDPVPAAGTAATLGVSAPTGDRWSFAAVEITPAK
ncbi:vWA domain-containing protein [Kitasatospora sp. NPDC002227]|uniref:vWA domain-containing protein n=1 Tax=Kitasatospora sp. NPDC002227 TaxID=3154773 RepID=UPI0033203C2C